MAVGSEGNCDQCIALQTADLIHVFWLPFPGQHSLLWIPTAMASHWLRHSELQDRQTDTWLVSGLKLFGKQVVAEWQGRQLISFALKVSAKNSFEISILDLALWNATSLELDWTSDSEIRFDWLMWDSFKFDDWS